MASRNPPPQGEQPGPEVVTGTRPTALDLAPTVLLPSPPVFLGLGGHTASLSNPPPNQTSPSPLWGTHQAPLTPTKAGSCPAPTSSPSPFYYSRGLGGLIGWLRFSSVISVAGFLTCSFREGTCPLSYFPTTEMDPALTLFSLGE